MRIAAFWEMGWLVEVQTFRRKLLLPYTVKWRQQVLQKRLKLVTWPYKISKLHRNRLTVPEKKQMTDRYMDKTSILHVQFMIAAIWASARLPLRSLTI
jgi:hypothetical protein